MCNHSFSHVAYFAAADAALPAALQSPPSPPTWLLHAIIFWFSLEPSDPKTRNRIGGSPCDGRRRWHSGRNLRTARSGGRAPEEDRGRGTEWALSWTYIVRPETNMTMISQLPLAHRPPAARNDDPGVIVVPCEYHHQYLWLVGSTPSHNRERDREFSRGMSKAGKGRGAGCFVFTHSVEPKRQKRRQPLCVLQIAPCWLFVIMGEALRCRLYRSRCRTLITSKPHSSNLRMVGSSEASHTTRFSSSRSTLQLAVHGLVK